MSSSQWIRTGVSRDLEDLLAVVRFLAQHGVQPQFLTQEYDASPQGRAFFQMRGVFAELERNTIRERTMRGRLEKARQGRVVYPGKLPKWLKSEDGGATVVLVPEWAEVAGLVWRIFLAERLTLRRVADGLTLLGYPTPRGAATGRRQRSRAGSATRQQRANCASPATALPSLGCGARRWQRPPGGDRRQARSNCTIFFTISS